MKNPITNLELFEEYDENPSNINSKGNKLIIDENHPLYGIEDEEDSDIPNFNSIDIPKKILFNLNEIETRIFYKYYYQYIHGKYYVNHELSFSGIIVYFGFIVFCYKKNQKKLTEKVVDYFKQNLYECGYKSLFLILFDSLQKFNTNQKLDFEKIRFSLEGIGYEEDENGIFSLYKENNYQTLEDDIYLNLYDFLSDIIDNDDFLKEFNQSDFEHTRKHKINTYYTQYLNLLNNIVIRLTSKDEKKAIKHEILYDVISTIESFQDEFIEVINFNNIHLDLNNYLFEIKGYINCLKKSKRITSEAVSLLREEIINQMNYLEEKNQSHENDDDDYDEENKYSLYDNDYYDPDLDLDQQHPDFDF